MPYADPETRRAYSATYYASHREALNKSTLAAHREWRQANPERVAYYSAKNRVTSRKRPGWKYYGGRGIQFLFESFQQFFDELGPRPEGMSLDRIDNDGNYEPGNVRWALKSTQMANRGGNDY